MPPHLLELLLAQSDLELAFVELEPLLAQPLLLQQLLRAVLRRRLEAHLHASTHRSVHTYMYSGVRTYV